MREDLVVPSEVVAGDDVDTGILLDLPVRKTETLSLGEQVGLGELSAPVFGVLAASSDVTDLAGHQLGHLQASVAFFRSRLAPCRGKPRIADWTILKVVAFLFDGKSLVGRRQEVSRKWPGEGLMGGKRRKDILIRRRERKRVWGRRGSGEYYVREMLPGSEGSGGPQHSPSPSPSLSCWLAGYEGHNFFWWDVRR